MATESKRKLLTPEQAADYLGVSPGTLGVWRSTKRYPLRYVRVGRRVMYRPEDVEAFVESRTESNTDAA